MMLQVSEAIGKELAFLGVSVVLGAALTACYDLLRILRRVVRHGTIWVAVEDFIYWLAVTGAFSVVLYQENDGMVRGFAFLGIVIGMLLYHGLCSRYVVRFFSWTLNRLKKGLHRVVHFLFAPMTKVLKKVGRALKKQLKKIWKTVKIGLCKL